MFFKKSTNIVKKMGFKIDQNGIINRYIREKDNWDEHLNKTKKFLLDSAENKSKEHAIILGSGWLLDVPLIELSKIFQKLTLVDIVHPPQIVNKVNKLKNVEIVSTDISNIAYEVYDFVKEIKSKKSKKKLDDILFNNNKFGLKDISNASFIVSLNILNQLDILICDYISKLNMFSNTEILNFKKTIQQKHVNDLPVGKSCLITDYEELLIDDSKKIIEKKNLVFIKLPRKVIKEQKWRWDFDFSKIYNKNKNTVFNVIGLDF